MLGFRAEMGMSLEKSTTMNDRPKDDELCVTGPSPRIPETTYHISLLVAPSPILSSFPSPSRLLRRMNQALAVVEALPGVDALSEFEGRKISIC